MRVAVNPRPGPRHPQPATPCPAPAGASNRCRYAAHVPAPCVLFLHGLEGSPHGRKARALAARFRCVAPALPTADFEASVACAGEAIAEAAPDLVVGSSFGGAVALALLQRGDWQGRTLLLAPAGSSQGLPCILPEIEAMIEIVHARSDDLVPVQDSRALARSGSRGRVSLDEVEDDHALSNFVASGAFVARVATLCTNASPTPNPGTNESNEPPRSPGFRIETFFEDPGLWPVTLVVLAHAVLGGALLVLGAVRARSPLQIAALLLILAMAIDVARRRARPHAAFAWMAGVLVLSVIAAWLGDRSGLL